MLTCAPHGSKLPSANALACFIGSYPLGELHRHVAFASQHRRYLESVTHRGDMRIEPLELRVGKDRRRIIIDGVIAARAVRRNRAVAASFVLEVVGLGHQLEHQPGIELEMSQRLARGGVINPERYRLRGDAHRSVGEGVLSTAVPVDRKRGQRDVVVPGGEVLPGKRLVLSRVVLDVDGVSDRAQFRLPRSHRASQHRRADHAEVGVAHRAVGGRRRELERDDDPVSPRALAVRRTEGVFADGRLPEILAVIFAVRHRNVEIPALGRLNHQRACAAAVAAQLRCLRRGEQLNVGNASAVTGKSSSTAYSSGRRHSVIPPRRRCRRRSTGSASSGVRPCTQRS